MDETTYKRRLSDLLTEKSEARLVSTRVDRDLAALERQYDEEGHRDVLRNYRLRPEHVKLLKAMTFHHDSNRDHSLSYDAVYPFGSSSTSTWCDIARILGWTLPNDDLSHEQYVQAKRLLHELPLALNDLLADLSDSVAPSGGTLA